MLNTFPFLKILSWFNTYGRHDLPWRHIYHLPTKERLYKVWVAEAMLQQTQVDRVIGYYTRFLKKYPTIESLAKTSYEELFPYWQGLGYYSRARNMIAFAQVVVEQYEGIIPDTFEVLRKLPGIGYYTAQAILSFGYDKPVLALDANLRKIFARYYFGNRTHILTNTLITQLEKQLVNDIKSSIYNLQSTSNNSSKTIINNGRLKIENGRLLSGRSINNALMDFGSTFTTFATTQKQPYPLPDCKWYETKGRLEGSTLASLKLSRASKKNKEQRTKNGFENGLETCPIDKGGTKGGLANEEAKNQIPKIQTKNGKLETRNGKLETKGKELKTKNGKLKTLYLCVFLHSSHRTYYSARKNHFEPFILRKTASDDRHTIQKYFRQKFDLQVSVRPSFGECIYDGNPAKLFYAQIQVGNHTFQTFSKGAKERWIGKKV